MIENLMPLCSCACHMIIDMLSVSTRIQNSHAMKAKRNLNDKKQPAEYQFPFEPACLTISVPGMWMSADPNPA